MRKPFLEPIRAGPEIFEHIQRTSLPGTIPFIREGSLSVEVRIDTIHWHVLSGVPAGAAVQAIRCNCSNDAKEAQTTVVHTQFVHSTVVPTLDPSLADSARVIRICSALCERLSVIGKPAVAVIYDKTLVCTYPKVSEQIRAVGSAVSRLRRPDLDLFGGAVGHGGWRFADRPLSPQEPNIAWPEVRSETSAAEFLRQVGPAVRTHEK